MRVPPRSFPPLLPLLFALTACGSDDGDPAAPDGGPRTTEPDGGPGMMPSADANPTPMPEAGGIDAPGSGGSFGGPLMYTGGFTTGSVIPPRHKCLMPVIGGGTGDNISPMLEWTGGPEATQSFALVLYDTRYSVLHWVVWDIPRAATSLPEGIAAGYDIADPAGAHQVSANGNEYFGPCSTGPLAGTYEYRLYALDTASLSLTESSTPSAAQAAVEGAMLEVIVWAGTPE